MSAPEPGTAPPPAARLFGGSVTFAVEHLARVAPSLPATTRTRLAAALRRDAEILIRLAEHIELEGTA